MQLSVALFVGTCSPRRAGRLADRYGAGRVMSLSARLPPPLRWWPPLARPMLRTLIAALVGMELAACFVLYATAFVAIVQLGDNRRYHGASHISR